MHRFFVLLLLAAAPAAAAAPFELGRAATGGPAMPVGYPTLFMGPPRGNFPAVPPRSVAPTAPPPASAAPLAGSAGPAPSLAGGMLCRAAIGAAERDHALPAHLLTAIGRVESGRRDPDTGGFAPWPWTINAEGRGSFFPTKAAAIAAVRQLQAEGVRSIDVGCMQVNLRHHPTAFANLDEAFDPSSNARYAGRFLRELQAELGDWNRAAAAYHSRVPEFSGPYQAKVLAAWADEQRNPSAASLAFAGLGRGLPAGGGLGGRGGGTLLSNNEARAQLIPVATAGGGRGLDAYRSAPIAAIGRLPVVFNGPYRRL